MTDYLAALRDELVDAADRLAQPAATAPRRNRRWRRSPRALAVAAAALTLSATALAATTPWRPYFGDPEHPSPQPRVTGSAPPAEQLALLGVLRRDQTPEDRGATTQQALRYFGTTTQDVHSDYIRRLPIGPGYLPAVLVPARSWEVAGLLHKEDVLCVFVAERNGDGGAKGCYTTEELRRGRAGGGLGSVTYGLVPDGVAEIRVRYPGGTQRVPVRDNFFEHRALGEDASSTATSLARSLGRTWVDGDGHPTSIQPG